MQKKINLNSKHCIGVPLQRPVIELTPAENSADDISRSASIGEYNFAAQTPKPAQSNRSNENDSDFNDGVGTKECFLSQKHQTESAVNNENATVEFTLSGSSAPHSRSIVKIGGRQGDL